MSSTLPVTVLVATKNEELNIRKCLEALEPAGNVVVVDSDSSDGTAKIAGNMGAKVVQFTYRGGYPKKRQWVLNTLDISTPWVLLLDADEVVPEALWDEISEVVTAPESCSGYLITKGFHFLGRRFRFGGFSHAAVVLFRTGAARFEHILDEPADAPDMEIHERLIVDGPIGRLRTPLVHEDWKGLEAYIARHNTYSTWEARFRRQYRETGKFGQDTVKPRLFGDTQQRRRFLKAVALRIPGEPVLWFVYHYLLRLGFLEGRAGLIASRVRADCIAQVRAKLYEMSLASSRKSAVPALDNSGPPAGDQNHLRHRPHGHALITRALTDKAEGDPGSQYHTELLAPHTSVYLWPTVLSLLPPRPSDICEIGCGNGAFAAELVQRGHNVVAFDDSQEAVSVARSRRLDATFEQRDVNDPLPDPWHRSFDVVVSLEVVEHLFLPRVLMQRAYELLRPGGLLVLSTPYHGYLKNVAMAISGRIDRHFDALSDRGHIKFFSNRTLRALLVEAGFHGVRFSGCGRVPLLWKSVVASCTKPGA